MERARRRNREHLKRVSVSDITHAQELTMRKRARKCPLCDVRMTSKPHLPNSKELDHILPVNQGGTHTHGNVRIICRRCNQGRPKDGSDFTGQLTLWAHDQDAVSRKPTTCRAGLHPWTRGGCKPCRMAYEAKHRAPPRRCICGAMFSARGDRPRCDDCLDGTGRLAAELHASGLTWKAVAEQVGYASYQGACDAARRIGYMPVPRGKDPAQSKPGPLGRSRLLPCHRCGGPVPDARGQRRLLCEPCRDALAWEAVAMRTQQHMTLRAIADQLGYDSITSVTNLMKGVVTIESKMGRPRASSQVRGR